MLNIFSPIWTLAKTNYKEMIRDKLLYGIFIVAALVVTASFFLATISLGQDARILQNIGIAAIHITSLIIVVFITTTSLARDYESNTLYLLFPKPISRAQYLLGKYGGSVLLLLTALALLGGFFAIGLAFTYPEVLLPLLISLAYFFMELSLLAAVAILFSTFTAPLNATLYTIALFFIGHSLSVLRKFVEQMDSTFFKFITDVAYYLLPNLEKFSIEKPLLYDLTLPALHPVATVIYWILYTTVVLFLAVRVLKKIEL